MTSTPLIPVILCGGTGTRLWPLSRASYPKQYWPLSGEGDATLLQQTQQRLTGLSGLEPPLLICNEDHRFIVAEQMRQIDVEPSAILLEPMGRNTAPAVTVAALQATASGDDPLLPGGPGTGQRRPRLSAAGTGSLRQMPQRRHRRGCDGENGAGGRPAPGCRLE